MIQQRFRNIGLKLAGLGLMIAVTAPFASALAVTYTTTGVFSANDLTQTNLPGAVPFTDYVTYTGSGVVNVNAPANPASVKTAMGSVFVADSSGTSIIANGTFTLTINQSVPVGIGSFGANATAAIFSGTVGRKLSGQQTIDTLTLTFNQTSVQINGVEYTLNGLTGILHNQLDLKLYNNVVTAQISQLPEPTFMALTGFGFAGLCLVAFRRRRSA